MKYTELFKRIEGQNRIVCGHFDKEELKFYITNGYKKTSTDNVNKNGIKVL